MTKQQRLYGIRRQLDLLGYRADRLNPVLAGHPHRQDGAPAYPVRPRLGFLTLTARAAPSRCGSSPQQLKKNTHPALKPSPEYPKGGSQNDQKCDGKMIHSALSSGMIFQSQLPLMSVSRPCLPSRFCQPHARVGVAKPTLRTRCKYQVNKNRAYPGKVAPDRPSTPEPCNIRTHGARPTIVVKTGWSLLRRPTTTPTSTAIAGLKMKRIISERCPSLRPSEIVYKM